MRDVNALVLTGFGLNCDYETAYTLELAGANARRVHINSIIDGTISLDSFQIMVFGGGFSWGDDHGAGVLQAVRMQTNMGKTILEFIDNGNIILGICNGFQTLVNMGLLPGFNNDYQRRCVALTNNDCGNFRDQWVKLKVNERSPCVFTRGFHEIELPVRHGEGKFVSDAVTIERLIADNQVVIQYADNDGQIAKGRFPDNPNGSTMDIAGICDPTGRIFGLMPHPEGYNNRANHPDWHLDKETIKRGGNPLPSEPTPGTLLLKNAVDFIRNRPDSC